MRRSLHDARRRAASAEVRVGACSAAKDGRSFFIVANRYSGTGTSDGIVLTQPADAARRATLTHNHQAPAGGFHLRSRPAQGRVPQRRFSGTAADRHPERRASRPP